VEAAASDSYADILENADADLTPQMRNLGRVEDSRAAD